MIWKQQYYEKEEQNCYGDYNLLCEMMLLIIIKCEQVYCDIFIKSGF